MVDKMEDIRCPMCGKPNPSNEDVCQYCGARLKPLTGPLSESPGEDDWLGSLRSEGDLSDASDSDWASNEDDDSLLGDQRDPLAWLSALDDAPSREPERDVNPPVKESQPPEDLEPGFEGVQEPSEAVDLSAWLASLDADEDQETGAATPPAQKSREDELPEWLRDIKPTEPQPEPDDDVPGWLASLGAQEEAELPDADADAGDTSIFAQAPREAENLPGWSGDLAEPEELAQRTDAEETPLEMEAAEEFVSDEPGAFNWVSNIPGEESSASEEMGKAEEVNLPEWLQGLPDENQEFESAVEGTQPAEDASDWYQAEMQASEDVDANEAVPAAEIPDWLKDIQSLPQSEISEAVSDVEAQPTEEELPDWMLEVQPPEEQDAEPVEPGELPDWLADLKPTGPEAEISGLEETNLGMMPDENVDWLSDLASEVQGMESQVGSLDEVDADSAKMVPFALDGELDKEIEDLYLTEEPDWLADIDQETPTGVSEPGLDQDELAPAELPGWLAAMRPVDSVIVPGTSVEEESMEVQTAGPLAGLSDVLPAEMDIFTITRPEALSVRLDVSDGQQKHIALLEQMLSREEEPKAKVRPSWGFSQKYMRWVVFVLFLIAAIYGLMQGAGVVSLPIPAPEVQAVNTEINTLSPQAPVLVAFDYEPGLSGEMDSLANILLDHLMLRGARLTLISTTPTGPALGESVLRELQAKHNYGRGIQYVNLGYLPGGPTGLQSLVNFPIRYLMPYTFSGYEAWEPRIAPLAGIEAIDDYELILVITDRQETARAWVEQVAPGLEPKLLVAASAQIGPLIRPYYSGEPQYVDGFIAGLVGSGAYERLIGIQGKAGTYWGAYTLLVIVSAVIILVGALLNYIITGLRQSQPKKGEQTNEPA
jgi:hypothetical protein